LTALQARLADELQSRMDGASPVLDEEFSDDAFNLPDSEKPEGYYFERGMGYAHAVVRGEIDVCEFVKLACQRQINDLARQTLDPDFGYTFILSEGERICHFLESLPHIKGPKAGELMDLEPWQCFRFITCFGWVVSDNHRKRRFRRAYTEVPRGNGKSFECSGLGLYALAADDEEGAEVYSAATSREQARIVFDSSRVMAKKTPDLLHALGIEVGAHSIFIRDTASAFKPLSAEADNLDGLNIHFGIVDELHAHPTREVYDVLETALGKRHRSMIWVITTAGSNRDGICYEVRNYVIKILRGIIKDENQFGIIYTLDENPYEGIFTNREVIKCLQEKCECHAQTTLSAEYLREVTADLAMTNICESAALTMLQSKIKTGGGGKNETGRTSLHIAQLGQKQTEQKIPTSELLHSTALTKTLTKLCLKVNAAVAEYANSPLKFLELITITAQEMCEDCYAANVIADWVFSETLKKQLPQHSRTCPVSKLKPSLQGISGTKPPDDWTDPASHRKANPNWGISVMPDVIAQTCLKAKETPSAQNNFKTKHLNVWVSSDSPWMDMPKWDAGGDSSLRLEHFEGEECVIAFDLATKVDINAKVYLFERVIDGLVHYYAFLKCYLPEDALRDSRNSQYTGWQHAGWITVNHGSVVDFDQIESDLEEDLRRFNVREVPFDPWQATQFAQRMAAKGAPMVEYRNTVANFSAPMKEIEALVKGGRWHHDGNPVFAWMASNVVCHIDAKDNIYPRKELPANKIDGIVASISALGRRIHAEIAGPSVYETRGIMTIEL